MENKNGAGPGAFEKFFAGKGFYIVLALCAAVIGVSAWSLFAGGRAVQEEEVLDVYRPAETSAPLSTPEPDGEDVSLAEPPGQVSETPKVQPTPEPTPAPTPAVTPSPAPADTEPKSWLMPVLGTLERPYSVDTLMYDRTMGDWRTHDGVDYAAAAGSHVKAAAAGTVTDVYDDALYGTTVVISHGGGWETVYSNLAALPTVETGDSVAAGDVIGAVGDTALCEAGEVYHLHFAMRLDGESADPEDFVG